MSDQIKANDKRIAVGDPIWYFDINNRVYRKDAGHSHDSGPIYREHWVKRIIVGETSRSWLIGYDHGLRVLNKVPKKGPHPGWAFSIEEIEDDCWIHEHRYKMSRAVSCISSAATLREVARVIGWKPS